VTAVAVAALVASPPVSATTIRTRWLETTNAGYPAMSFRVTSLSVGRGSWSVRASVTNRSRTEIRIVTEPSPYLPYRFGLFVPSLKSPHGLPETLSRDPTWRAAVSFAPKLPAVLSPGRTWGGTFAGRGSLPSGRQISVTFGVFASPRLGDFSWTTAHAFTL
jgi:hypothetical protein